MSLISFGLAWVLITFSINLAPRTNVIFEHKLYLISFGFFLALVALLAKIIPNRVTLFKGAICLVVILAAVSYQRNKVWANELVLWQDCLRDSPNKARVNANLGRMFGSRGDYDRSIYYLSRAISISHDNITFENRGVIYAMEGRMPEALDDLNHSIAMSPNYFPTYLKRSWVYQLQHNYQAAFADLGHALQLNAYYTDGYIERGLLWVQLGNFSEALNDFQQALKIDPYNNQALEDRSYCMTKLGQK